MSVPLLPSTPRETALVILDAWFGSGSEPAHPITNDLLAPHQLAAANRLDALLPLTRIAILADSLGIGKTHTAIALMEREISRGGHVLIVAPAALRTHWQRHLRELLGNDAGHCGFISHTALSFGRQPTKAPDLIVVDEAHQFRNPATHRYRTLARLARHARMLLLTATPINNSIDDLYHLIRLGVSDRAFLHLGVADLRAAFKEALRDPIAMRRVERVLQHIVIRRSREHIAPQGTLQSLLRFPRRLPVESIRYELDLPGALDLIEQLEFPAVAASHHSASRIAAELLRLQFLKRLESGAAAFEKTVHRYLRISESAVAALDSGQALTPAQIRSLLAEDAAQLTFTALLQGSAQPNTREVRAGIQRELELLRKLHRLAGAAACNDSKLQRFEAWLNLITHHTPHTTPHTSTDSPEKVLIFTQFRDTAVQLWRQLRSNLPTAMVCGESAWLGSQRAGRATVVECFAPRANRATVHDRTRVDVLISTDVLSEGMNLQDARTIVSYDIPWNPVTLMQRTGRVDRIGSPHESVRTVVVLPDRDLDRLLGLVDRVERKIHAIERTVGVDAPVLDLPASNLRCALNALRTDQPPPPHYQFAGHDETERLLARWQAARPIFHDGVPRIAVLPGAQDATMIALRIDSRLQLLVQRDGRVADDTATAAAILTAALDSNFLGEAAVELENVFRWVESEQRATALTLFSGHTPENAIVEWLYDTVQRTEPAEELITRIDHICRILRLGDHHASQKELTSFLSTLSTRAPRIDLAVHRLEQILGHETIPELSAPRVEIIGIIQSSTRRP